MNQNFADIRTFDFRGMLNRDLLELARPLFERHAARIAALSAPAAAQAYQREKRALIETVIGALPKRIKQGAFLDAAAIDPTQPRPQVLGRSSHEGVTIERVVFQSVPGVLVTALLYRPEAPAARRGRPAVVFVCGHSNQAKTHPGYLAVQMELARNGFVVLAIDPHGQGERQYLAPFRGEDFIHGAVEQHFVAGIRADLTGCNIARWFVADIMSAVDVLERVPEVDPQRIGVTGSSGGGTQTAYAVALETRFAAAAPSCYITDREQYLNSGQMQDHEQNFFRAFSAGICHHDFLILAAPRPLLVLATRGDFFPVEGARLSVARARHVYNLFKAGRNLELNITEERHIYSALSRHRAVEFFRRHLGPAGLIGAQPWTAETYAPLPPADLRVTPRGQLLATLPDLITLPKLVAARPPSRLPAPSTRAARATRSARSAGAVGSKASPERRSAVAAAMADFWSIADRLSHPAAKPVDPRRYTWPEHPRPAVRDSFFFTEARAAVFLREIVDPAATRPPADAVVIVPPKAGLRALPEACWALFRHLALSGVPVVLLCPRGIGPTRSYSIAQNGEQDEAALASTERTQVLNYLELGTPLAALQACDIAAACSRPRSPLYEQYHGTRLHLCGFGASSLPTALGALFSPVRPASLRLVAPFGSLQAVVAGEPTPIPEDWNLFGLLQFADLPELYALAGAARNVVINPLDSDELPLANAEAQAVLVRPFQKIAGARRGAPRLEVHCKVGPSKLLTTLLADLI